MTYTKSPRQKPGARSTRDMEARTQNIPKEIWSEVLIGLKLRVNEKIKIKKDMSAPRYGEGESLL